MFLLYCPYQVPDGCEEQDMRRPSQPGVSEAVLTGLIGKSCTKHWKQIFIIMVEFMGSFIPVAMAWLADKFAPQLLLLFGHATHCLQREKR